MKRFIRWYYVGGVGIVGAILVLAVYLTFGGVTPQAFAQSTNISGWAWSGTTGWISLTSANCEHLPPGTCTTSAVPYGLDLTLNSDNQSGTIQGYAWSQNMGWLCFGSTCGGTSPTGASPNITFTCEQGGVAVTCDKLTWSAGASGDAPSAELTGWARAVNVQGSEGWIELRNNSVLLGAPATWAKLFLERGICDNGLPGVCTTNAQCGAGTCTQQGGTGAGLGGWAWSYAGGGAVTPYGLSWISFDENTPEVLFPYLQARGGDVFSGGGIRSAFPPPSGAGNYNAQYLVHVRSGTAGDLSARFRSACTDITTCRLTSYSLELPNDPTGDVPYTFQLGRFDFLGLMTAVNCRCPATGTCRSSVGPTSAFPLCTAVTPVNKYGSPVSFAAPSFSAPLGGQVYMVDGNFDIPAGSATLLNGATASESGAGTIIVRGDLNVGGDIAYQTATPATRVQLASVVWIVLGDVNVASVVQNLAGTFIVLGHRGVLNNFGKCVDPGPTPYTTCTANSCSTGQQCLPWTSATPNICVTPTATSCATDATCGGTEVCRSACLLKDANGDLNAGCGRFVSGVTSNSPLMVSGSVFARQFKLQRTYVDVVNKGPSERFTADGRLQLNPPPGMVDFAKGLPSFRRQ